jgi:Protein of unknown function (DUF1214)
VPCIVHESIRRLVPVYDARTRSQIQTAQAKALLSSLFDFGGTTTAGSVDLFFGPAAPAGHEDRWLQTNPGAGWFVYFRVYGPEQAAFDKTAGLPWSRPSPSRREGIRRCGQGRRPGQYGRSGIAPGHGQ